MRVGGLHYRFMRAVSAALLLCSAVTLTACGTTSYAGLSLAGAADSELQSLAARAQAGDKHAQLELGVRLEEGRGVAVNWDRADRLYRQAAASQPLSSIHSLPTGTTVLYSGATINGLPYAFVRRCALQARRGLPTTDDCVASGKLEDLTILASYDLNFDDCSRNAGFTNSDRNGFRELRQCLVERAQAIECGGPLFASADKIGRLAISDRRLRDAAGAAVTLKKICSGSSKVKDHSSSAVGNSRQVGSMTPIDAVAEVQEGRIRRHFEHFEGEMFMTVMCRLNARQRQIQFTEPEQALCDMFMQKGSGL